MAVNGSKMEAVSKPSIYPGNGLWRSGRWGHMLKFSVESSWSTGATKLRKSRSACKLSPKNTHQLTGQLWCVHEKVLVAQLVENLPAMQETWFGKRPWRREQLPTPVFSPGESHGQRGLVGYSPCGRKESDMTERLTLSLPVYLEETNFGIQRAYRKNNFKLILRGPHEFEEKRPNCV